MTTRAGHRFSIGQLMKNRGADRVRSTPRGFDRRNRLSLLARHAAAEL
jgi:hypothetical protein